MWWTTWEAGFPPRAEPKASRAGRRPPRTGSRGFPRAPAREPFSAAPPLALLVTVKSKVGRARHVALALSGRWSRASLAEALKRAEGSAQLTRFDGAFALVRVRHDRARALRATLEARESELRARPIGTSGTVRAAVAKFVPSLVRSAPVERPAQRSPVPDRDL